MSDTVDNPFFARLWTAMSSREPESLRRLRRQNLTGLSGRVLEVGAGTGTNFLCYPATVTEGVAAEPERRLAVLARKPDSAAVLCSLVLCSVDAPAKAVGQLFSMLRPGGELRYLEHVASAGPRARLQRIADATLWPRMFGNCHTHRHTEETIVGAGFRVTGAHRDWTFPAWVPVPVAEFASGVAVKPA